MSVVESDKVLLKFALLKSNFDFLVDSVSFYAGFFSTFIRYSYSGDSKFTSN